MQESLEMDQTEDKQDEIEVGDDNSWILELESALLADCELDVLKKITNNKSVPDSMRYEFWQACLGVKGRSKLLEEIYDLPEQQQIRDDCQSLVEHLGNDDHEKVSIRSDLESIVTNYSKLTQSKYTHDNGWLEILEPLLALKLKREELFKFFESISQRYIPKCFNSNDGTINSQPFHFLRLILLYHDPELCSFLDTRKITPELYAVSWFRSLFSAHSNIKVTLALWDVYFSLANPFLIFFLALVMLVNEKEEITKMKDESKESIIDKLKQVPSALCLEDIGDLFYLVEQHYVSRTPQNIHNLHPLLFQSSISSPQDEDGEQKEQSSQIPSDLAHLLCLPVPVGDLLPGSNSNNNINNSNTNSVRYFVVDCRPADQYNNGHLSTAFHLDCSLMLQEPSAFNTAVQALLAAQKSVASGHHLCFMGSGRDEEDQYVHMVVSSFLQKNHQFVSLAYGGYIKLHQLITSSSQSMDRYFVDHNNKKCLVCTSPKKTKTETKKKNFNLIGGDDKHDESKFTSVLLDKVASVVKTKTNTMKEKLVEYVTNPTSGQMTERHVSASDKLGKRYKVPNNRFTIDDKQENDDGLRGDWEDDESGQEIDVNEWGKNPDVIGCFKCQEIIRDDGYMCPSYLGLTHTHLFIMREIAHNKGFVKIIAKRPLEMIVQITSKRRRPDLITFKYGQTICDSGTDSGSAGGTGTGTSNGTAGANIVAMDHILISNPYNVTRLIKQQVIRIIDGELSSESNTSSK